MAKKFKEPVSYDHEIVDNNGKVGEIRVKPSTLLWKAKGAHSYKGVSIEDFEKWIMENGKDYDK
jgi:hypothetical protein